MTDEQLLALAWKANGDPTIKTGYPGYCRVIGYHEVLSCECMVQWNPLLDNGDALMLAVKLHINVHFIWDGENDQYDPVYASRGRVHCEEQIGITIKEEFDEYAATRRAIVRAAAEIGKQMEQP